MPRLDARRVDAWRRLQTHAAEVARRIDDDLVAEWDISLGWFDVLAALRDLGGAARPIEIAEWMCLPASSLSRRLDRLEEEGWIERHRGVDPADGRVVEVRLTRRGRNLWREMNVTYRRSVQAHFASWLTTDEVEALHGVLDAWTVDESVSDEDPDDSRFG